VIQVHGSMIYLIKSLCTINKGTQVEFYAQKKKSSERLIKTTSLSLIENLHSIQRKRNTQLH
jgi:hypothetical protein